MTEPNDEPMNDETALRLMADFVDGTISEADLGLFNQWVTQSSDNAKRVARYSILTYGLSEISKQDDANDLLGMLQAIESEAECEIVDVMHPEQGPSSAAPARQELPITRHDVMAVAGYVGRHALTPRRLAFAGVAAALAIAATVFLVLQPGQNEPTEIVTPPIEIIRPAPAVATLTNTHDAVWTGGPASAGPRIGDTLRAGQKLTLTAGFAEITTNKGAVVILDAPATIELLDNDNALRLHTGKLVGICETESSKGFLVRTPHMDITDLGTRFGVDASIKDNTRVTVIEGEVELVHLADTAATQPPQRLTAGQAVIATVSTLTETPLNTEPYAEALNLAAGMADLRPHVEGDPVLWRGMARDDMTTHQQEADLLQVYLERQGVMLQADVLVDTLPGESWPSQNGFGKAAIPAGTRVDVYLLHLDSFTAKLGQETTAKCTMRFDRPIIGLIGAQSTLRATDQALGHPGTDYADDPPGPQALPTGGGVGMDAPPFNDTAVLSADGRTLTLDLLVVDFGTDQVRVLVQSRTSTPLNQTLPSP